ncbi:hypothetical protein ACWT_6645 [Actinoplanes sp. SE50]|uniref:DUF6571 family protein n=1 Tax=unclassified Actinoplanes TaxID=2626549 RepID=UPI00023EC891|nr:MULTISPECIES: DUF6571 family protein [unclassified Actinoplanes]AEV87657.1 hypothetical protein ACPL_6775 [Actinoplanes sp. SE50/110]ATO86060.1 hypothetical protein ACWT_6645 [Actinoplanes sp. SE50]SLM03474.1 uncharacterized protein ACSP50_6763 [Actinoplanes sp. SE50/110]
MSGLTLQDLLEFDAGPWHSAADVWQQVARGLDTATDQLIVGTRDLVAVWPHGGGSEAARQKAAMLRAELENTYLPAKRLADAFDQHAYAMKSLRSQAEGIVESARHAGYTVDSVAVTITAPASAYMGGDLDRTGRETGTLLNDLRQVVEYARAQDDATAATINGNVPSPQNGFGASPPGAAARAEELAKKLLDSNYRPTPAELDELRNLITLYGRDKVFDYDFLTALGPKGLLQLNGVLATYQPDGPGKDADGWMFSNETADTVRDLQNGLGLMLATATEHTGTQTGPRGDTYVPGDHELSGQWVGDLMAAGRSKMTVVGPYGPPQDVNVYGYQLLSPLLHNGSYDARFLTAVGGDMVDFEMSQGKNSGLWTAERGDNLRLDWTHGHDDNTVAAGYDPMNGLMDALSRNPEATRDLLTGVTSFSADGPVGGRLDRLDYLLTDRNWNADVPGGSGWSNEVMQHGGDYKSTALDDFGTALESATTGEPSPQARHIVESIIYETGVDEQAQGYHNGVIPGHGKSEDFAHSDLIQPQLRQHLAKITSAYIFDVNLNIADGHNAIPGQTLDVDHNHLVRFLADLGKDPGAHETIAKAEAAYAAGSYDEILSGRQNPHNGLDRNLSSMENVSHNYGSVMGALDKGANDVHHITSAQLDEAYNNKVESHYKIAGRLVDEVMGKVTSKITVPVAGDLAKEYVDGLMSQAEEQAKVDNTGHVTYEVGQSLGAARNTAVGLTEQALYDSGKLEDLPERLLVDGHPKPVSAWDGDDIKEWQRWKAHLGQSVLGNAANSAGDNYQKGYEWAGEILK